MRKIKLDIRRFGRIRNSNLELTPLMVFSGESGLGKSYLAILVHYFFEILVDTKRFNKFFTDMGINFNSLIPTYRNSGTAFTIEKSDLEKWLAKDAIEYVQYMINNKNLQADISVSLPPEIPQKLVCDFEEDASSIGSSAGEDNVDVTLIFKLPGLTYRTKTTPIGLNEESPFSFFMRYYLIMAILGNYQMLEQTFVLPPSRGAIMTERVMPVSGLYKKFDTDKSALEGAKPVSNKTDESVVRLMHDIMEGRVSLTDNQYVYKMDGEDEMPLTAAASSIRELAPLELLIENTDISKIALLFEEPEAHLHPMKQRSMAELVFCMRACGANMQITTHSDYFIRRFNELFALAQLKKQEGSGALELLSKVTKLEFNTNEVSAYLLEKNEDGTSFITKQQLEAGIPFTSFRDALKAGIDGRELISNLYMNESHD